MHVTDHTEAGYWPLQHHDNSFTLRGRRRMAGVRVHPADGKNFTPGRSTYGDVQGGLLWEENPGARDNLHSWFLTGAPAVNTGGGGGTGGGGWVPIRQRGAVADDRYRGKDPALPAWATALRFPKSYTATVTSGTEEYEQHENLHPDYLGLFAVNKAGDPAIGSPVYDLTDANEPDPNRMARLQSAWTVVDLTPGGCSVSGKALALNIGRGGRKDGGSGHLILCDHDNREVGIGSGALGKPGPITLGDRQCVHTLGTDADGRRVVPGHLKHESLFIWPGVGDAPLAFEGTNWHQTEPDGDHWYRVHMRLDREQFHAVCDSVHPGLWSWEVALPFFIDDDIIGDWWEPGEKNRMRIPGGDLVEITGSGVQKTGTQVIRSGGIPVDDVTSRLRTGQDLDEANDRQVTGPTGLGLGPSTATATGSTGTQALGPTGSGFGPSTTGAGTTGILGPTGLGLGPSTASGAGSVAGPTALGFGPSAAQALANQVNEVVRGGPSDLGFGPSFAQSVGDQKKQRQVVFSQPVAMSRMVIKAAASAVGQALNPGRQAIQNAPEVAQIVGVAQGDGTWGGFSADTVATAQNHARARGAIAVLPSETDAQAFAQGTSSAPTTPLQFAFPAGYSEAFYGDVTRSVLGGVGEGVSIKYSAADNDLKFVYRDSTGAETSSLLLAALGGGATGDVTGPASATDNAIARFDGTGGKNLQNGTGTLSDTGLMAGVLGYGLTDNASATRPTGITTGSIWRDGTNLYFYDGSSDVDMLAGGGIGGSGTDNKIVRWDGTGAIQNSGWSIDDSDVAAGVTLTLTNPLGTAYGGTGGATASAARTNLGLAIGTDVQAYDSALQDISGLGLTDGNFIVANGTNFVAESGATARTSLGLGDLAVESSPLPVTKGGTGLTTIADSKTLYTATSNTLSAGTMAEAFGEIHPPGSGAWVAQAGTWTSLGTTARNFLGSPAAGTMGFQGWADFTRSAGGGSATSLAQFEQTSTAAGSMVPMELDAHPSGGNHTTGAGLSIQAQRGGTTVGVHEIVSAYGTNSYDYGIMRTSSLAKFMALDTSENCARMNNSSGFNFVHESGSTDPTVAAGESRLYAFGSDGVPIIRSKVGSTTTNYKMFPAGGGSSPGSAPSTTLADLAAHVDLVNAQFTAMGWY